MIELADDLTHSLDAENPWPGLMPFTEATRAFFHGRDAEAAELLRRVRRERLTILFGQSGLGKTSLLFAGLFPRLRTADFLPVYLRLDPVNVRLSPVAQIKQALAEMERMTILRVFEKAGGDKALAGRMLGISRATLYRKLKRYNIPVKAEPGAPETDAESQAG